MLKGVSKKNLTPPQKKKKKGIRALLGILVKGLGFRLVGVSGFGPWGFGSRVLACQFKRAILDQGLGFRV